MKVMHFNHIGINVKDFEKSLHFYRDILGFKVQMTAKMPDCTITYLLLDSGERIELFDYSGNNKSIDYDETRVGYRHIAIEVDDPEAWEEHLIKNGIPIVLPCTDVKELGVKVLLFQDPNGIVLEFCKPL